MRKKIQKTVITALFWVIAFVVLAQPSHVGTDLASGSWVNYDLVDRGSVRSVHLQASSSGSGRNLVFTSGTAASPNWNQKWGSYNGVSGSVPFNVRKQPSASTHAAMYIGSGGQNMYFDAITAGNYYTIVVSEPVVGINADVSILETTYNPVLLSSLVQNPAAIPGSTQAVTLTLTTSATPNASEKVWVRYSLDSWASSTMVQATGGGTSWVATIPAQPNGTTVSYYAFTSIGSVTASTPASDIDYLTLEFNNNGGGNYQYTVTSALPVIFSAFNAKMQDKTVLLDWNTASENQNSRFEIERSSDAWAWENIGSIDAKGYTTSNHSAYSFIDYMPNKGINYYRLKQVDIDGKFSFSTTRSAVVDNNLFSAGPNPATTMLCLKGIEQETEVDLLDIQGNIKASKQISNDIVLDLSAFMEGTYLLRVNDADKTIIQKIMIVR